MRGSYSFFFLLNLMRSILLFLFLLGLATLASHAQAPGTGGPTPDPTEVPLDGGAALLLASGVAYGLRRLRRQAPRAI